MSIFKQLLERIQAKLNNDDYEFDDAGFPIIDLNKEAEELFGPADEFIEDFNRSFKGKYEPHLVSKIVRAGPSKLDIEFSKAFMAYSRHKDNFASLVEDMIFGDGELNKKANIEKDILSERMFCFSMAKQEWGGMHSDLRDLKKDYKKATSPGKLWWNK